MNSERSTRWRGETYHGLPALKPAGFDAKVAAYIAILGMAGAAQVIAACTRRADPPLASRARGLALAGAVVGPAILIGHLKTPRRWYNMLRIFRPNSPMSWGSWLLAGFGASSFVTWAAGKLGWRRLADAAQLPAAATGAGMATYTAALLSATSNPLWAAAPGPLGAAFGASSMASGASALALLERGAGRREAADRLDNLSLLALCVEAVAMNRAERAWQAQGVAAPIARSLAHQGGGKAVGLLAPAALTIAGRSGWASLAVLAGSALMRHAVLKAGDRSAQRAHDALGFHGGRR
jgi:formate-dependent nitrite reductase membrane component NrfD